ncbi:Beta-apo-4'-carotenal oxygenase [Cyberlindnera fabianii]|uniref:Aldehyde dehydrogenase n=1 Tax=Cyberlindnera fabianii TaxID=36022 RepID=A0A1V2L8G1_CYBFA|nr:Beta-apo-4'-carotenal oxygenase [Cyberlindnera fabianii]
MSSVLEYTPIEEIPQRVEKVRTAFHTRKFLNVEVRLNALRNLFFAIKDNEDLILKALKKDLNKPPSEVQLLELSPLYGDLLYIIDNLRSWVKGRKPESTPLLFKFSKPRVENIPLGTVLVIGAFNFPLLLTLQPLIGAIAGGNTVVIKQSEQTPNLAAVVTDILSDALDNELIQIVNGGIEETTALLEQKFDKVIYTGSGTVGTIIAKKCAETLTPCILELGGKSPAFITKNCRSLDLAAKRIVFAKFVNAGQTCVTVDYAQVHRDVYDEFVKLLIKWTKKLFGEASVETYGKIVNQRNTERVANIIKDSKGEVIYGGDFDIEERYISPTVVKDVTFSDSLMQGEIFGPVLPVVPFDDLDAAITNVVAYHDTPLALYAFTDNKDEIYAIQSRIRSGAFLINDAIIHVGMAQLPFGGIGSSGNGNYHGYASFKSFTHERSCLKQPFWVEPLFEAKYPPTTNFDLAVAKTAMVPPAWFGRTGKIRDWRKIFKNTMISMFLLTGLVLGLTSDKENRIPTF